MASLNLLRHGQPYPQAELNAAWKKVLTNQFHDILPGSSIAEVCAAALSDYDTARQTAQTITDTATRQLAVRQIISRITQRFEQVVQIVIPTRIAERSSTQAIKLS